ncbi:MAG TPA: hypothetical protein VKA84_02180, partial [Gemmatimonadaceae bacterium]|nr:hypothetical protein [Gemmatimonadaceae bacterium]
MRPRLPRRLPLAAAALVSLASSPGPAQPRPQQPPLGVFEGQSDVGTVSRPGSAAYDAARQRYTVSGSGANMWAGRDDFHFVWKRLTGDFILSARAELLGAGVEPHRKVGWIVRGGLGPDAPHVTAAVHGDGLVALHYRRSAGGATEEARSPVAGAD